MLCVKIDYKMLKSTFRDVLGREHLKIPHSKDNKQRVGLMLTKSCLAGKGLLRVKKRRRNLAG